MEKRKGFARRGERGLLYLLSILQGIRIKDPFDTDANNGSMNAKNREAEAVVQRKGKETESNLHKFRSSVYTN